ncbi:MAG: ATP-dependent Clp protease proteolytic subunit [Patescibacteria group bacterium]
MRIAKDKKREESTAYEKTETLIVSFEKEKKIFIANEIDEEALPYFEVAIDTVLKRSAKSRKIPLRVYIHSPGGTISTALGMYDTLRELDRKIPVWTIVKGNASSAALLLSQAGRTRLIYPNAFIQFHSAHIENTESYQRNAIMQDVLDIKKSADMFRRLEKELKILNTMLYKILHERTGLSLADIRRYSMESKTMTAQEAVEHGLFDGIAGSARKSADEKALTAETVV